MVSKARCLASKNSWVGSEMRSPAIDSSSSIRLSRYSATASAIASTPSPKRRNCCCCVEPSSSSSSSSRRSLTDDVSPRRVLSSSNSRLASRRDKEPSITLRMRLPHPVISVVEPFDVFYIGRWTR